MEDLIVRLANDLRKKGRNVGINETLDAIKALRIVNTKNDEVINHILEITIIKDFKEKLMTKNNKDEKKEEYNRNVLGKCIYGESNNTLFSLYSPAEANVEPKTSYNWERERWIKAIKNLRKVILAIEGHRNKKSLKGDINLRMTVKEETKFFLESPRIFKSIKKRNKAKAVLLCDVSGSMRDNQDLILSFSFYMKKFIYRCEIFFFSTKIKKVTRYFMKDNISGINLEKIIENFPYGGGTRIGESLNIFRKYYNIDRKTAIIILSDGWDLGDLELLDKELNYIKERSLCLIWINPLLESPSYKPETTGIKIALKYVDLLLSPLKLVTLEIQQDFMPRHWYE